MSVSARKASHPHTYQSRILESRTNSSCICLSGPNTSQLVGGMSGGEQRKKVRVATDVPVKNKRETAASSLQADKKAVDELFQFATKKKRDKKEQEEKKAEQAKLQKRLDKLKAKEFDPSNTTEPQVHRWDAESGLPVYKYYDLGMAKPGSGMSPLCPFDCDCCF